MPRPNELERESRERYRLASQGEGDYPSVLYCEDSPAPPSATESGLYVDFHDFRNVVRTFNRSLETRVGGEAVTALYHSLVLHFADTAELREYARTQLRYNFTNSSGWNTAATTYYYSLLGQNLLPYAEVVVPPEIKIPGIAKVGHRVIMAVMRDEIDEPPPEETLDDDDLV